MDNILDKAEAESLWEMAKESVKALSAVCVKG